MLDIVFLAVMAIFFVVAIGYADACDRGLGGA